MELVYRALWRDDRLNPEVSVMEIFDKWSGSSKVETLNASGDGQLQVVEMRSNSSEERRTTIRIISQREDRYVWVDVEDFSSNADLIWMLDEQGLIQELIDDSEANRGSPRRGEIRFQSRVQLAGLAAIELIPHQSRKAAVICVAHDPLRENDQKELAKLLARQFAGIALVVYLPPGDLGRFQNSIGKHLSLYPGEIRVYPPAAKGSRNVAAVPSIRAWDSDHTSICRRVLTALQPTLVATAVPSICEEGTRILRGFQSPENEQMRDRKDIDFENLLRENERLRQTVASLYSERDHDLEAIDHLETQLLNTKKMMQESEDWWRGLLDEETAKRAAAEAERTDKERLLIEFALTEDLKQMRKESVYSISSISEALDRGRAVLRNVVIPQNVSERIDDLDGNPRSRSWGRSIWGALLAFNVFAESEFSGNFLKWCATSGDPFAWHAQNISMRESDTVHNTERLRNQRVLPVSTEIDPSGRAFMEAHLKFGGSTAPRLYFLDDTKGRTGQIHIGGLDPHSRWENTTT